MGYHARAVTTDTSAPPEASALADPAWFRADAIAPTTAALNRRLARIARATPGLWTLSPAEARALRESWPPLTLDPRAETRAIPGPAGAPLGMRIFRAEPCEGFYLHFHPGGWVLGAAHHQDTRLARIADATRLTVVSVEYRLAPEYPYPAAPDDAERAALWLAGGGGADELGGPARLAIGGESAGAQLAVVALLRLRDRHAIQAFRALVASYGTFDLAGTPSARAATEPGFQFDRATMAWYVRHFVDAARLADPDVSPLHARLDGLPPALFSVGTLDPVVDDTLLMHERWVAAGNRAELAVYPGGVHGFDELRYPLADEANARIHAFLRAM
ncbi:MAG: alpha/beta hydrolase [Deltaproteobacteria bacterium]|nr:alpha/beta hydrolase [Deltaproteobacteria bacterium]